MGDRDGDENDTDNDQNYRRYISTDKIDLRFLYCLTTFITRWLVVLQTASDNFSIYDIKQFVKKTKKTGWNKKQRSLQGPHLFRGTLASLPGLVQK